MTHLWASLLSEAGEILPLGRQMGSPTGETGPDGDIYRFEWVYCPIELEPGIVCFVSVYLHADERRPAATVPISQDCMLQMRKVLVGDIISLTCPVQLRHVP